jgi:hypothetical protein
MDLLANRETPATRSDSTQLLVTPAVTKNGLLIEPLRPAIIQHAAPAIDPPAIPTPSHKPRTALLPIPPPASIRRDSRNRTKTLFYKPHDIRAVTAAIREIMNRDIPTPSTFPTDNDSQHSDTDIMRSYAIDTLFDSAYYTGDTEEIETTEALRTPDRAQFIDAIKKEVHSLISETRTLQPLTKTATGYAENTEQRRVLW